MPTFHKEILPVGEYLVTRPDGTRTLKKFSKTLLNKVVTNANKMLKSGLKIPAPFKHYKEAVPVEESLDDNAYENAGYWKSFDLEDIDGTPTLTGMVEAPGTMEDTNTPAGKLNHTVQEVSACIKDSWTDGRGREWGPCILHGAPVLHPVVPGQKGFSLMDDAVALSASGMLSVGTPSSESIGELAKELEDSVGVYLPTSTLPTDLIKVLLVSLKQHKMTAESTVEDQEIVDTQSIFMSIPEGTKMPLTKVQAEELVKLGAVNPKTQKAFELSDFEFDDNPAPTPEHQYALALTAQLTEEKKSGLRKRVNDLVISGRTTKEHAEGKLYPEIDSYELSLGDGATFQPTAIDLLVDSLEALPVTNTPAPNGTTLLSNGVPPGQQAHEGDPQPVELTKEEAEAMKAAMLEQLA